jgi:hypothetical protein
MVTPDIDDALSAALNSLAAAQAILRKSAPPRSLDVLRKMQEPHPDDIAKRAEDLLADLERRTAALEGARDMDAQHALRKTYTNREVES